MTARTPNIYVFVAFAFFVASATVAVDQACADVTLTAPREVSAGAELEVSHSGATQPNDFISIDEKGAQDRDYGKYAYVKSGNPVKLRAPDVPGEYEIRYHLSTAGYEVQASLPLTVHDVEATIEAPAQVVPPGD